MGCVGAACGASLACLLLPLSQTSPAPALQPRQLHLGVCCHAVGRGAHRQSTPLVPLPQPAAPPAPMFEKFELVCGILPDAVGSLAAQL